MSVAYFLAKRIHFSSNNDTQRVSPPAIRIAIAGIAIGIAVILLTVAIVIGFKQEIRSKVSDFGGHLQVLALASNRSFEKQPICLSDSLLSKINQCSEVEEVKPLITKPAVIKTPTDFLSVVISSTEIGEREICVSETIARKLKLKVGDKVQIFFVQNTSTDGIPKYGSNDTSIKARSLTVASLYQTHFNQYDDQVIFGNIDLLRQVSGWDGDMVSGLKIRLKDFELLDDAFESISEKVSQTQDRRGTQLVVQTLQQQNPQLFSWLDLLDTNVWIILVLMIVVSTFTMISGLLIIILERAQMIGLLKALGYDNKRLRVTFIYIGLFLSIKGLTWGNLFGLGLCIIQAVWHPIALDPDNYYLEWVPIAISWWQVLILNLGALLITILMLIVPSALVTRISPSRILAND